MEGDNEFTIKAARRYIFKGLTKDDQNSTFGKALLK